MANVVNESKSKKPKSVKVPYIDTLDQLSRQRYIEKLKLIKNIDPYEVKKSDWKTDRSGLPNITYPDLVVYLVYKQSSYTMEDMKAYKSLEAYNYFVSGWVKDVSYMDIEDYSLISGRVKHSQRMNDPPLQPWVISQKDVTVVNAHCNCMAGLGEACSHVAALLFYVDATVRIRSTKTVTQEPAYWLIPNSVDKLDYNMVKDINFQSSKSKKKHLDELILSPNTPRRQMTQQKVPNTPVPSATEMSNFYAKLFNTGTKPVLLSVMPDYAKHYVPSCLGEMFPPVLSEIYDEKLCDMNANELQTHCEKLYNEMTVSKKQIENVEFHTRNQAASKQWFRFRTGHITASHMKAACVTNVEKPSKSTIQTICYPVTQKFNSKATKWGCDHESDAFEEYSNAMTLIHENFDIQKYGFL